MGKYIVENLVKNLIKADISIKNAKVAILGFAFKENCPDTRNTRVIDIVHELEEYGIVPIVTDPEADTKEAKWEYGVDFTDIDQIFDVDAVILAVAHKEFTEMSMEDISRLFKKGENNQKVLLDVKGLLDKRIYEEAGFLYWRL